MATNSYIQRKAIVGGDSGKRLMLNINSIRRTKGTQTTDLLIPGREADKRQLLPLTGQVNDFVISCTLREEFLNIGYTVNTANVVTGSDDILTIIEQYDYLFDTLLSSKINSSYLLYIDWLNKSYTGQITIDSNATERDFTGEVEVTITFKEGGNFISLST